MHSAVSEKQHRAGFTLIELMIVIAIIAILVSVAVPQFMAYRQKGSRADLNSNLKNAFTAAQGYLSDHPLGTVTSEEDLTRYGFKRSSSVSFDAADIGMASGTLAMSNGDLPSGSRTGYVDYRGVITLP
jgi:prepilin-type N-terminal cleavage/methylation domain-containing protein